MSEDLDRRARLAVADHISRTGEVPRAAEVAGALDVAADAVADAFARLAAARVLILERDAREILAFNPFHRGPSDFRVEAGGRTHFAICGWDALGIPAALGTRGTVEASCGDGCGERLRIEAGSDGVARGEAFLHIGVPARSFWDDIHFT